MALISPENIHNRDLMQTIVDCIQAQLMVEIAKAYFANEDQKKKKKGGGDEGGLGFGRTCREEWS